MAYRKHVGNLVARCLHRSVLNFSGDLRGKYAAGLGVFGKVGVMAGITLDANPPALLGHPKHKRPPLLRIEVGVGEHQKALVLSQLDVVLQVVEYLTGVVLLHPSVRPDSSTYDFQLFEGFEVGLDGVEFASLTVLEGVDFLRAYASKENFENRLHIIDKHPLKVLFLGGQGRIGLILPHF